jgi:hypothetical protein
MAHKKNIFTPAIELFLKEMAALNLLSFNARCLYKTDAKDVERQIRGTSPLDIPPLRGAYLTGIDPLRTGERVVTFAGGTARGKELVAVNEETQLGIQALVLCLAVEEMREYLIRVTGTACWKLGAMRSMTPHERTNFEKANPKHKRYRGTATYCRAFAEWRGRSDMQEVVKALRRIVPQISSAACPERGPSLFDVLLAVQLVRNAIIHQRGAIDAGRLNRLPKAQQLYVRSLARASKLRGDRRLLPSEAEVRDVLFKLCVLAHSIYEHASLACGMNIEYRPSEH